MRKVLLGAVVLCGCVAWAWAQGTTSRVVGLVTDPSGAVIVGANVTLTNENTGATFSTQTTQAGTYLFEAVQVGSYAVVVEAQGFKKLSSKKNQVTIGQPATINATLEVGALAETVEVSGAAELVQTSSSGNFGGLITQRVLQDMPIVGTRGRNPIDLVLRMPGVVSGSNTGGGVHVHGARDRAWNYTLDGIDTNESSAGGSNFSPLRTNPDSLAEFQVITSNFTAEYGRSSGAQVAMVTRSGSNDLHATAFWFYRTPSFNANEWENNINNVGKRQFVQHIPGFSVGGPIFKNKTFFFTNWQFLRALQTGVVTRTVYTSEARKGNWRYVRGGRNQPAGVAGASVDASGNPVAGLNIGTYNVANSDPQRLGLDPTTQAEIANTPLPNNFFVGDGLNRAGFTFTAPERETQYDATVKVDHIFNPRNFLFGRFAWGSQDTLCDSVNGGQPRFPGQTCPVDTFRRPRNLAVNYRWNPTPRITNELVVGYNYFKFDFQIPTADAKKPFLNFTDITVPGESEFGNLRAITTYQVVDNFAYVAGAHNLKWGANIRYQKHEDIRGSIAGQNATPIVNFSTTVNTVDPTAFGIPTDINTAFDRPSLQNSINFMLGRVGTISQGFVAKPDFSGYAPGGTLFNFDARFPEFDFYFQDNWKFRRNLTVDLGLRWELKMNPRDPEGRIRRPNQAVVTGASASNSLSWVKGDLYDNDVNNFGPSIGLAWDPFGNGKTSVRSNYRISFDRSNTFVYSSAVFQSIPGIALGVSDTTFGQAGGRLRNLPSLAPTAAQTPSSFLTPPSASTNVMTVVAPDIRSPKTHMWGLSIQREVWGKNLIEASYIGRRGIGLYSNYDVNQADIRNNGFLNAFNIVKAGGESPLMNQLLQPDTRRNTGETGSQMVRRLFISDLTLNNVAGLARSFATRIQGGRTIPELAGLGSYFFIPFPQFSTFRVLESNGFSTYHALELKAERRSGGLYYLVGYTWSKSLDTGSYDPAFTVVSGANNQSASSTPFDIYNRRLNYAKSDFDRAHVLQATWAYELPFGRGKRWLNSANGFVDRVFGGWEVSGFMTIQTGRPWTVDSGANTFSNTVQTPANCNGCRASDGEVFEETGLKFYLDAATRGKFSTPAPGEFGNTGRNFLTGPGSFSMAGGVLKRVRIWEQHELQYRAEFTNITNTPTFGFPTATITSTVFGRIRDGVISGSRKIQMALKYSF